MDPTTLPDLSSIIPLQWQVYGLLAMTAFGMIGKFLGSLRTGGGLRRMLLGAWYGENIPPVVAADYKAELSKPSPSNPTQKQNEN